MRKKEDLLKVNNSALYHAFQRMIVAPEKWQQGKAWLTSDLSKITKAATAHARIGPEPGIEQKLSDSALEEWRQKLSEYILSMDDLTADIFDLIASKWVAQCISPEQFIVVKASDLLAWRGLNPTVSGFTTQQKEAIAHRVALLASTWIEFTGVLERKKHPRKVKSRAIVVTSVAEMQEDGIFTPYLWRVRPGDLFIPWLFGAPQFTFLSKAALRYDYDKYSWEKRIARFCAWLFRIQKKDEITILTAKLLAAIHMELSESNPKRTRLRMEHALTRLCDDGVIHSWSYIDPERDLLECSIQIFQEQVEINETLPKKILVDKMKEKRKSLKWTQSELARVLQIIPIPETRSAQVVQ